MEIEPSRLSQRPVEKIFGGKDVRMVWGAFLWQKRNLKSLPTKKRENSHHSERKQLKNNQNKKTTENVWGPESRRRKKKPNQKGETSGVMPPAPISK